ncbi:MAG: phage major capsid protein, partial [Candidatus Hydrogenedentota bacterium]
VWLVDQSVEPQLYTMSLTVGTGGSPVYLPAGGASASPFASLFGRPVIPIEYGAALGTSGDIMLVDLSQYTVIDKGAIEIASSIHVRFLYDEQAFRFVWRLDGQPQWNSALTPKSGGDTLSAYITLAGR